MRAAGGFVPGLAGAAGAGQGEETSTKKKSSGASRSDGFWTTLGKSIIRSGVPMATRVLESAIKRGTLGGIRRG